MAAAPSNRNPHETNFTYPPGFTSEGSVQIMRITDSQDSMAPGSAVHDPKAAPFAAEYYGEDD